MGDSPVGQDITERRTRDRSPRTVGNETDVISDYGVSLDDLLKGANADQLAGGK
jgi:hypothetical protein